MMKSKNLKIFFLVTTFSLVWIVLTDEFLGRMMHRNVPHSFGKSNVQEPIRPANPEWEQLNKFAFFRRSAAAYLADQRMLRLFYVTNARFLSHMYQVEIVQRSPG